mmetsp:Transcript_34090/g.67474  ORF Transcript_34090/g.67474 Transcript_34090/m.67474 type:complete len:126 (-) Transcript_34090:283-660(-)
MKQEEPTGSLSLFASLSPTKHKAQRRKVEFTSLRVRQRQRKESPSPALQTVRLPICPSSASESVERKKTRCDDEKTRARDRGSSWNHGCAADIRPKGSTDRSVDWLVDQSIAHARKRSIGEVEMK